MNTKAILGVAVLCVVGAFFAGRELAPTTSEPGGALTDSASSAADEGAAPQLDSQKQVIARLSAELDTARQENETLAASTAGLREKLAEYEKNLPPPGQAPAGGVAYAPEKYTQTVSAITWPEAGEAAAKMVPLLDQLAKDFVAGKPVTTEVGIAIFKHNQKLQTVAVTAIGDGVPGAGGNGAFTHPVVTLNLIQAALAKSDVPLDASQLKSLREIGDAYMEADARRVAGYDEETFELQKTMDECALKDRMFADIHAVLTGKQSEILHPETIRGRLGIDIYSSGTIWYAVSKAVDFTTREDLATGLVQAMTADAKMSDEETAALTNAAKDWANGFSEQFLEASADPIAQTSRKSAAGGMMAGWQKVTQATQAAVHQLALYRALYELVGPDSPHAKDIRTTGRLYIPLKRP